jgi:spore germination cell wall hydrolase CwlJ-like protein
LPAAASIIIISTSLRLLLAGRRRRRKVAASGICYILCEVQKKKIRQVSAAAASAGSSCKPRVTAAAAPNRHRRYSKQPAQVVAASYKQLASGMHYIPPLNDRGTYMHKFVPQNRVITDTISSYARHYNPGFVYFLPHFSLQERLILQTI